MREDKGWSLEQLASMSGMSRSYLSEIERGVKKFNSLRLEAIAKSLGVEPVDLIDAGSVDQDILGLIQRVKRLSPEDRASIIRHAIALDLKET